MGAAGAVIMVVSALYQNQQASNEAARQRQMANEQDDLQKKRNAEIQKVAIQNMNDLSYARDDIDRVTDEGSLSQQLQAMRTKATISAQAAASGTKGHAVDQMLGDVDRTFGQNIESIANTKRQELLGLSRERENIQASADAQKTYQTFNRPQGPSTMSQLTNLFNSGLKGYGYGSSVQDSRTPTGR